LSKIVCNSHDFCFENSEPIETLATNTRLPREYRDNKGEHPTAMVAPIHPLIDQELGEEPRMLEVSFFIIIAIS
jgi:hypothetical protein